jgi:hypothetical protein
MGCAVTKVLFVLVLIHVTCSFGSPGKALAEEQSHFNLQISIGIFSMSCSAVLFS